MTTKQRTDLSTIGDMLQKLNTDLPTAIETESLNEWGDAMAALARYQAERMRSLEVFDPLEV